MKFYSFEDTLRVNLSKEEFWNRLALDFGHIAQYAQGLHDSYYETEQRAGIGTRRHCKIRGGGYAVESVIEWEEYERISFVVERTSMPMQPGGNLQFVIQPFNSNEISVEVHGSFRMKYFPFLSPLMRPMYTRIIMKMIKDLERGKLGKKNPISSKPNDISR